MDEAPHSGKLLDFCQKSFLMVLDQTYLIPLHMLNAKILGNPEKVVHMLTYFNMFTCCSKVASKRRTYTESKDRLPIRPWLNVIIFSFISQF